MEAEHFSTQRYTEMRHLRRGGERQSGTPAEPLMRRFARTAEAMRKRSEEEAAGAARTGERTAA